MKSKRSTIQVNNNSCTRSAVSEVTIHTSLLDAHPGYAGFQLLFSCISSDTADVTGRKSDTGMTWRIQWIFKIKYHQRPLTWHFAWNCTCFLSVWFYKKTRHNNLHVFMNEQTCNFTRTAEKLDNQKNQETQLLKCCLWAEDRTKPPQNRTKVRLRPLMSKPATELWRLKGNWRTSPPWRSEHRRLENCISLKKKGIKGSPLTLANKRSI